MRFGKVHVFNNLYEIGSAQGYTYTWGVGVDSHLFVENNVMVVGAGVAADRFIRAFSGRSIHVGGTLVDAGATKSIVDVIATYNAANDPKLTGDVGWTPTYVTRVDPAEDVVRLVRLGAGPSGAR